MSTMTQLLTATTESLTEDLRSEVRGGSEFVAVAPGPGDDSVQSVQEMLVCPHYVAADGG